MPGLGLGLAVDVKDEVSTLSRFHNSQWVGSQSDSADCQSKGYAGLVFLHSVFLRQLFSMLMAHHYDKLECDGMVLNLFWYFMCCI